MQIRMFISKIAAAVGLMCLILATAEPVILKAKKVYVGKGKSIMFVIDVSPSMAACSINGETRLHSAKKIIAEFAEKYPGGSLGLTVFASYASLLMPPTFDKRTFLQRLEALQIGELGSGTAIGLGLASAIANLPKTEDQSYIILLTDGENNSGSLHPELVLKAVSKSKIGFYVIGIGKTGYSKVEYTDPNSGKNYKGSLYTEFNEAELKKIARYGNGKYAKAESQESLKDIFKVIASQIPAAQSSLTETEEVQLYRFFLNISLISFTAAWCIRRLLMGVQL